MNQVRLQNLDATDRVQTGIAVDRWTDRARRSREVFVAVGCLVGMILVYVLAVCTQLGQVLDTSAMVATAVRLSEARWPELVLSFVTPFALVLGTLLIAAQAYASHGATTAAKAVVAVVGTVGGAQLLKGSLVRPELLDTLSNSWPSGHVATVAALSVGAYLAAPHLTRPGVAVTGSALVTITSMATFAEGWHRPSDAVGAVLLAVACGALCAAMPEGLRSRWSRWSRWSR